MPVNMEHLHRGASDLLEAARADFVNWAQRRGVRLSGPEERVAVSPELRGWRAQVERVDANVSWRYLGRWRTSPGWHQSALDWASVVTKGLHDSPHPHSPGYNALSANLLGLPPEQFTFEENPSRWLLERTLMPAVVGYIRELPSAGNPDDGIRARIVNELVDWIFSGTRKTRLMIAVAGLDTDRELISSPLGVRRLSALERGDLLQQSHGKQANLLPSLAWKRITGDLPTHLLWYTWEEDLSAEETTYDDVPLALLASFGVHEYFLAGLGGYSQTLLPTWGGTHGASGAPLAMATWANGEPRLTEEALTDIAGTFKAMTSGHSLTAPGDAKDLALHRFALGCSRDDPVDALLDFVIALEALLLPLDRQARHGDLGYRFRLHGAYWMAQPEDRATVFRHLRGLYETRSRLVHGGQFPEGGQIREQVAIAQRLTAKGLRLALVNGFPDAARFNRMLLEP